MTFSARRGRGIAFILAAGFAGPLAAQSPQVYASDAVGVGRAGAGVAFGRSLEAATLNPALLPTLEERVSAYVSAGFELQEAQITLQSNQATRETTDRNRLLAGFGFAWRTGDNSAIGLKLDQPWERHGRLPSDAPGRFLGREWAFGARRLELQAGYELPSLPNVSFGVGVGVTRVSFEGISAVRALVPQDGTQPASGANPAIGLAEQSLGESAHAIRPSYTVGMRWAVNPRWTLAATYQSQVTGDLALSAGMTGAPSFVGTNGYPPVLAGTDVQGNAMLARSTVQPGAGSFKLPAKATLGVRNRVNNLFTWEFDLRATGAGLSMPAWASLATPSGTVNAPSEMPASERTIGFSAMGEVDLTKRLVLRGGVAYDPASVSTGQVTPAMGGQAAAQFSIGATYRVWGGELSAGYAFRQAKDALVNTGADGTWNDGGYTPGTTPARIEGMGHLLAIGYKIAF